MSKKHSFRGTINKQNRRRTKALLKSPSQHLYVILRYLPSQLRRKKSLILRYQIFGLLNNTLAADEKYSILIRKNITIPIQMHLSEKQKTFSEFLAALLKSRLNFKHFDRKGDTHSFSISEVTDSKNVVR